MEGTEEIDCNSDICLISSDGKRFVLSFEAAKLSEFVCNASDFDNGVADIKLLRVGSNLLAKVVEYLNRYKQQPMNPILTPLQDHTFNDFVKQQWYRDYVTQLDDAELRELKDAADYMSIDE